MNRGADTAFLPKFRRFPSPRGLHSSTVQSRRAPRVPGVRPCEGSNTHRPERSGGSRSDDGAGRAVVHGRRRHSGGVRPPRGPRRGRCVPLAAGPGLTPPRCSAPSAAASAPAPAGRPASAGRAAPPAGRPRGASPAVPRRPPALPPPPGRGPGPPGSAGCQGAEQHDRPDDREHDNDPVEGFHEAPPPSSPVIPRSAPRGCLAHACEREMPDAVTAQSRVEEVLRVENREGFPERTPPVSAPGTAPRPRLPRLRKVRASAQDGP